MVPRIVAAIFARGGSKGVLHKNLRPVAGIPLIGRAIQTARSCARVSRTIVSTDSPEIADAARRFGADVPFMRPAELAADDSPEWLAWQHAIRMLEREGECIDVFLAVPPTAPLRAVEDLDACIDRLLSTDADLVFTVKDAQTNPYFNMVTLDDDGTARLAMDAGRSVYRRQIAPRMYDIVPVAYATRPAFVLRVNGMFEGRIKTVLVPAERSIDIDTETDLVVADCLARRRDGAS